MKNSYRIAVAFATLLLTAVSSFAQLPKDPEERAKVIAQIMQANARQLTLFDREGKELNVIETLNVGFGALQPAGMTPSSLALNADQTRLFIGCSDTNTVAVADISETRSRVAGPTARTGPRTFPPGAPRPGATCPITCVTP